MVKATTNVQSTQTVLAVALSRAEAESAKKAAESHGLSLVAYLALAVRERIAADTRTATIAVAEGIDLSQGYAIMREEGESDEDFARREAVLSEVLSHASRTSEG